MNCSTTDPFFVGAFPEMAAMFAFHAKGTTSTICIGTNTPLFGGNKGKTEEHDIPRPRKSFWWDNPAMTSSTSYATSR